MNYIPEYFEIIGNRLANPLPEGVKGEVKSEEHRRKISETLTGRKDPLEVREKKSAALRKRWDNMSEEKRREISEKRKAYWARKRLESNGSTK